MSPFWVYGWRITNTLSILHRFTGLVLALGLITLVWWLMSVAGGAVSYERALAAMSGGWFKLLFTVFAFCFFYHLANGIRHLCWDTGRGFSRAQTRRSGWSVVVVSIVATLFYLVFVIV
jgi:succinate dehydrogenase / fumarate reductase cytochrome b subunit